MSSTPLVAALKDPTVAVAGGWGLVLGRPETLRRGAARRRRCHRRLSPGLSAGDALERGPLDERFRFYRNLDIWWSLVLRDGGEGETPRRAVRIADMPADRHEHRGWTSVPEAERDRLSKRNFYRIIDRFGSAARPAGRQRDGRTAAERGGACVDPRGLG